MTKNDPSPLLPPRRSQRSQKVPEIHNNVDVLRRSRSHRKKPAAKVSVTTSGGSSSGSFGTNIFNAVNNAANINNNTAASDNNGNGNDAACGNSGDHRALFGDADAAVQRQQQKRDVPRSTLRKFQQLKLSDSHSQPVAALPTPVKGFRFRGGPQN